jgi:hypothetical protein
MGGTDPTPFMIPRPLPQIIPLPAPMPTTTPTPPPAPASTPPGNVSPTPVPKNGPMHRPMPYSQPTPKVNVHVCASSSSLRCVVAVVLPKSPERPTGAYARGKGRAFASCLWADTIGYCAVAQGSTTTARKAEVGRYSLLPRAVCHNKHRAQRQSINPSAHTKGFCGVKRVFFSNSSCLSLLVLTNSTPEATRGRATCISATATPPTDPPTSKHTPLDYRSSIHRDKIKIR